jgi:hypothetical protein
MAIFGGQREARSLVVQWALTQWIGITLLDPRGGRRSTPLLVKAFPRKEMASD